MRKTYVYTSVLQHSGRGFHTNRVIAIWNSLSDHVVSAETINTFKNRLDSFWSNQDVLYDYGADLHGIRNRTIVM